MTEEEKKRLRKALASEQASGRKVETTTALRERFEASQPKVAAVGGISEGSEYNRGSISALRSNYSQFEREQPEAAAILKQLAEERAAREQKEQRSADMLFGVGAIRTADGLQKRMEAQLMAEVPGGMSPFTSVDMDLAERSAMQRAINARAKSMPHSVDTEYSIVEGAALDRDKIAAYQQMLQAPVVEESTEELSLWEKIKGRPEAQSDATKLALASYAANLGEAAASVEEASPLRYAEDLPSVFGAQVDDFQANTVDRLAEEVQANIAKGTYSELENQLTDVGIRAGLDALVMLATGGGSAGVQAAGGMSFVTNMAGNPMFWTSFVQEYGSLYDEMTENGTDPQKAASVAAMAAAANAAVEVGGGTEKMVGHITGKLPAKKGWDLAKTIVQGGAEEALEEAIQAPIGNLAAKATYDPYREAIDPEEIAKNAGMAFLVGGILGGTGYGGQAAVQKIGESVEQRNIAGAVRAADGGAGMIRAAKESDIPELMELANEYEAQLRRGKALSTRQLADLYNAENELNVLPDIGSGRTVGTYSAGENTSGVMSEDKTAPDAEETVRTNVPAAEAVSDVGEKFAAEEAKAALTPRGVELSEEAKAFTGSLGEHGQTAFMAAEEISGEDGVQRAAWQTYYNAGKWGKDMAWADQQNPAARALLVGDLTAEQAFKAGQMDAAEELRTAVGRKAQAVQRATALKPGFVAGDGAQYTSPAVRKVLSDLSGAIGTQIELTDLGIDKARGIYDPKTGGIQLNSRLGLQGALINVAKHEVTHRVQDLAPEAYQEFKDFAVSTIYAKDSRTFEDLVQEQIDAYAEMGVKISRSEAEDEVVANAAEAFLRDEESIRKLCEKDRSLGQKILDAIRDIVRKIKKVLKGAELEQEAAQILSEDLEALEKAEELWLRALAESKEAMKAEQGGDAVAEAVENGQMGILPGAEMEGGHLRYNLQTTTEDDMKRYRQMLAGTGMSEAEMADLFGFFSEIRGIIEAHKDILDFEVDLEKEKFRPVKPNSDPLYKVSVDFSTLCRKRLLTQTITERLQAQLKRPLSKEEQLEIRNRLVSLRKELSQIDVACGLCYVESRRLLSAKQIGAFFENPEVELRKFFGSKDKDIRRKVNEEAKRMIEEKGASSLRELARISKDAADEVRAWKRAALASYRSDDSDVQAELEYAIDLAKNHREVFLSAQSLHDLMDEHPMVYDAFTTYVRNATKSKAQETRVPWRPGDSQKISDALIRRMNAENGLRMQSWSDYEAVNTLDYITAVMELSARGAKVQTYTKVPDFVRLMGRTGAMINLSLIAKGDGVDADGKLLFDSREGMSMEDAAELREEYSDTAGTIIVGISDEHILAALKDDRIDYVIPYHTSGMSKEMRARAGILHWTDYESSQSEKGKGKAPSFSEWASPRKGDDLTDGTAFMKKASERYLELCHERGLTPKFSQFLKANGDGSYSLRSDAENYWKLLIDRKMVDNVTGGYIEQQAVRPVFDEQAVKDILGRELVSEAAKQNAKAADIVVDEFLRGEIEVSDETIETVRQMEDSHLRYGIEEAMKGVDSETGKGYDEGVRYSLEGKRKKKHSDMPRFANAAEAAIMRNNRFERIRQFHGELPSEWYAFTSDHFFIYANDPDDRSAFTLLIRTEIDDGNRWRVEEFKEWVENGYHTDGEILDEWTLLFKRSKRRDYWYPSDVAGGNPAAKTDGLSGAISKGASREQRNGQDSRDTGRDGGHLNGVTKFQLTPEARERGRLIRENERLKKANAHLREGFKLTKGVEVSEADVEALAKKILKRYSSDADAGMLAEALRKVYRYIGNDVEPGWETVNEVLSAAAGKVLEDSREFDRSLWEETAELRARIRETPVYVDEAMRSEFALADGYQAFKRSHSRMFKIVNDPNAMSVDQLYTELAKDYPFMLDGEAMSAYDQLQEIADFIEASKPRWQNPFGENLEEMTAELVGEMYDAYFDLPQVKTFADKKQAEIDRMRMKHRAAMQELKEAEKQKREERLAEVKERYEDRIRDIRDSAKAREARLKYEKWWGVQAEKIAAREAREKARDRRYITEHRRKIERKVKALSQALLSPTDMKHVPEGLRNAVKNLVGALDMTGARGEDTNVSKAWAELQAAVVAARADTNSCVTLDPDLEMRIGEIVQSGMSLNEMNRAQAEDLYKVLSALEKACREVRIELKNGRTVAATEVARGIIDDTAGMKRYPAGTVAGRAVRTFFDYDLADPVRFAERFGSHMQDMMQMLRDGHDEQTRRWNEALDYSEEMFRKAQVWKWQEAKATEFELESGEKISLNPARVMELYLLSRREQALSHIYAGGITTKEYTQGGRIVPSERVQVTVNDVAMIIQSLTDEQKQVADRMGHFLSHQASDWGNEVSMELYGYRKFTEKNYWPISSDRNYIVSQMDGNVKDGTLAGLGMTKQTVKNAGNPIMIGDAFETYAKHLTQMAAYSAFVPRLEQAKLVINWKTSHDGNFRSAKESIGRAGGESATDYLDKLIVDLNGRGRVERAPTERFIGASKAAAIAGNVRVVVQQPTAYLRAAAEIDPKYLVQGLRGKRDAEEMKTYAPIARWKDWGFFEPGSGKQLSSLMIGEHGAMKAMSDIAMKPAGMMDNLTWGTLWNAVKAEVEATTDLEPGSEEYLQECGQRFSDVVDRTQVVDSVFHRTQAMRSGSVLVKMSTAFMAEPMKSLNMITGEIHKVMQANGRDAKAAAAKGLCRNVTAFMASAILNAVVVAFVDAARDDDDDETYWQKYRQALFGEYEAEMSFRDRAKAFLSADIVENLNPMSMIPYVKDAVSLYQGYDIQRTDVQSFAELSEDLLKWGKLLNGESKYTAAYLTKETASSLSKVFGLPVSNIIRDVMSLVNLGLTIADGQGANTTRLRYMLAKGSLDMAHSSNKNTFAGFMLEARMAGDTELATRIYNDMIAEGWTNEQLESAMTTRAKKLLEEYADVLDAYNAAEARADAAGMEDAADELLAEGFTSAEIVKAAKSRANDSAKAEEEELAGEEIGEGFWAEYGAGGAELDVSFLTTALVNGDRASAKAAEEQLRAGGKTQKEIDSAVASALKKRIVQGMGYEKIGDLPEGTWLDMDTEEYRVLHDVYGKTQFSFADAAAAYIGEIDITYSRVVNDMIGQKYSTSAGEKVYTKDLIREKVTDELLDRYKKGRYDGSAGREELTRLKNALDTLGIDGDELEEKYAKYVKGKK